MEKSMGARVNNELEACYRLRSFGGKQTSADLPQRNAVSVQRLGGPWRFPREAWQHNNLEAWRHKTSGPWILKLCLTAVDMRVENITEMFHQAHFETTAPNDPKIILIARKSTVPQIFALVFLSSQFHSILLFNHDKYCIGSLRQVNQINYPQTDLEHWKVNGSPYTGMSPIDAV